MTEPKRSAKSYRAASGGGGTVIHIKVPYDRLVYYIGLRVVCTIEADSLELIVRLRQTCPLGFAWIRNGSG